MIDKDTHWKWSHEENVKPFYFIYSSKPCAKLKIYGNAQPFVFQKPKSLINPLNSDSQLQTG